MHAAPLACGPPPAIVLTPLTRPNPCSCSSAVLLRDRWRRLGAARRWARRHRALAAHTALRRPAAAAGAGGPPAEAQALRWIMLMRAHSAGQGPTCHVSMAHFSGPPARARQEVLGREDIQLVGCNIGGGGVYTQGGHVPAARRSPARSVAPRLPLSPLARSAHNRMPAPRRCRLPPQKKAVMPSRCSTTGARHARHALTSATPQTVRGVGRAQRQRGTRRAHASQRGRKCRAGTATCAMAPCPGTPLPWQAVCCPTCRGSPGTWRPSAGAWRVRQRSAPRGGPASGMSAGAIRGGFCAALA